MYAYSYSQTKKECADYIESDTNYHMDSDEVSLVSTCYLWGGYHALYTCVLYFVN